LNERVRLVDEVAQGAFQGQGFGAEGAGGLNVAGVLVPQRVKASGGQRLLLARDALHFAYPGVGIQLGQGEKLVGGLCDPVFHPQPVEQRALGLLLAGCDFDQALNEMGLKRRPALFQLWSDQPTV
jgi:hypothetical protein